MKMHTESKRLIEMKGFNKFHLLFFLNMMFSQSVSEKIPLSYCGRIKIQEPFLLNQNSSRSSLQSQMILCRFKNLYFRTSIGLFEIRSVDYENKLITISHTSCSPTSHFVSPHHLSAGFPPPPPSTPNSLLLLNCSGRSPYTPLVPCNDSSISNGLCGFQKQAERVSGCSFIDGVERGFDPKQSECTHYSRVYRSSSGAVELGTRISFDIPDRVPNPCNECERSDGNCGVGLRCACHPKKCKDKVISAAAAVELCGNMIVSFVVVTVLLHGF